jgi:rhamnosyltransferase
MKISVVIRAYNEQKYLRELLQGIKDQERDGHEIETVLVDSGSTDDTLRIAGEFDVRIVHIAKADFSFGRSLNVGCEAASGDALVFVSGHCIPSGRRWLVDLVAPLGLEKIVYSYGRQLGGEKSYFSECQIFGKYFPVSDKLPQSGFYVNNANAAMLRRVWHDDRFDEELTGLEDMHLAKRLLAKGYLVGYVAKAAVYHLHSETWSQVRRRFEREAIALQYIMPEVHLARWDVFRYFCSAVFLDLGAAFRQGALFKHLTGVLAYRFNQFTGSFRGNHYHRRLSRAVKEAYFYPR